ncbi:TIGR03088 family PEP-CTERM/XrtA system glycosyltransferase [Noviherbaspirillum sp.]|uniref:TIGR03088 family PEP-CTERM/XrtA system glycosyltransferase n=1 Tax=Noviherbaspirillum sp. TaxID=1926288 RepID=UPI002D6150FF|nr:TIGR03088 family PEP-CTERM/XrtA system glycosyltransferase [Noviherbaspirillum sp.]HZW21704.1 TIGR03088 family PEP-CTERM/XrtA system glycosyltransferase [Noviherbaspirillum sp.]
MAHAAPLVVHLIYRLDFGGLETLLAECVNRMPAGKYRHAIVCLTGYTGFASRVTRPGVGIFALDKPPGLAPMTHVKLWKLLRQLRPAVLHTYNFAALEYNVTAALAGVPVRVHAEHGRDASDPEGLNRKHNLLRSLLIPFIDCYIPVSRDLQRWLRERVGIPEQKNLLINNGVDTDAFHPAPAARDGEFVIGTVGRVQDVKDHAGLVDAFLHLRALVPEHAHRLRLAIVGDGPLLPALKAKVAAAGIQDCVRLPGARDDVAQLMQGFSVFALSSIAEGTPVTLLEAMACGLPVVATRVGGIPDAVVDGHTGRLVAPKDPVALAEALAAYVRQPELIEQHGAAARERAERHYSISAMVAAYTGLYDRLCDTNNLREASQACAE